MLGDFSRLSRKNGGLPNRTRVCSRTSIAQPYSPTSENPQRYKGFVHRYVYVHVREHVHEIDERLAQKELRKDSNELRAGHHLS